MKDSYVKMASGRIIWIKDVSGTPRWIVKIVGKRHGRVKLPRERDNDWSSSFIEQKISCFEAFEAKEYAFCEKLLAELYLSAEKLICSIQENEKRMGKANSIIASKGATSVQIGRTGKSLNSMEQQMYIAKTELTGVSCHINSVEAVVSQRINKAKNLVNAHIMAYWTGVLSASDDASLPVRPRLINTVDDAKMGYDSKHGDLKELMGKTLNPALSTVA